MKFEIDTLKKITKEYKELFPMYAIIFHMYYTIFFSSDCSKVNLIYYYIPFTITILYMISYELYDKELIMDLDNILDLAIKILEYIAFTQIRAKPIKCGKGWSKELAIIVWTLSNIIIIIRIIQKMYNEEIKKMERVNERKRIIKKYYSKESLNNDDYELKNISIN